MTDLFTYAEQRRDDGIRRAVEHADAVVMDWSSHALVKLLEYAAMHDIFMVEDVRVYAEVKGLPAPPDGRAWGAVVQRAAKSGQIIKLGYAPARSSNLSPKVQWGRP